MADNDVLRRDGVLVRITGFDDERTAYFGVMPKGAYRNAAGQQRTDARDWCQAD